ncbi:MAG: hypothetical protein KQA34_03225 [Candidatus Aenigmarchaeota archaeon]|nr:hypothetical protein [Candidatus Aenigmarchaeota archaeon]
MVQFKELFKNKNKLFLVIFLTSISLLTLYFIFILNQPKYEIVLYHVETNITEGLFGVDVIKAETFYIKSSHILNFYKYYFSSEEDANKVFNRIIEFAENLNNIKIENIKIMNYNAVVFYSDIRENIGVMIKKENKLLTINIKNLEKDIEVIKWFLKNYF